MNRADALQRLEASIDQARTTTDAARYLTEHLAEWGADHFDVAALAAAALDIDEDPQ